MTFREIHLCSTCTFTPPTFTRSIDSKRKMWLTLMTSPFYWQTAFSYLLSSHLFFAMVVHTIYDTWRIMLHYCFIWSTEKKMKACVFSHFYLWAVYEWNFLSALNHQWWVLVQSLKIKLNECLSIFIIGKAIRVSPCDANWQERMRWDLSAVKNTPNTYYCRC